MSLPKKYRHKYQKKQNEGEAAVIFMAKVMSLTVLFFVVGIGLDVYKFVIR